MAVTQIADVIVPRVFTPYVQQLTEEKTALIQAGALVPDAMLNDLLAGGGLTFDVPSWKDLENIADNVSTDTAPGGGDSTPQKIGTSNEVAVRLSRNQSWSAADLAAALAGDDPMDAIANRVAYYRSRRLQAAYVATITGVFADNAAAPTGSEHVINDMTVNISGGAYIAGVTDFSAEAFIDAVTTMGDSADDLGIVMMHSVVYARAQKNNLIDFIPDSEGRVNIPTFLGRRVIRDDGMPKATNVYDTWIFGPGAVRLGMGSPRVPTEVDRKPAAANGGGVEELYHRWENIIHPVGIKYAGSAANGGPSNLATANNLAHLDSWARVFPERKQIKIARLISREA
ncbi:MAG: hypothetical protein MOB07_23330 [Acidobacteria bacterium]|nr:hypothetical protein [Acidobacteriota bacterium]